MFRIELDMYTVNRHGECVRVDELLYGKPKGS